MTANNNKQTGKIMARVGRNYTLEFDSGGFFSAESDARWAVGIRVLVVAGVIVSRAGKERNIKFYQV